MTVLKTLEEQRDEIRKALQSKKKRDSSFELKWTVTTDAFEDALKIMRQK